jgi:uncharacterized protein DUF3365
VTNRVGERARVNGAAGAGRRVPAGLLLGGLGFGAFFGALPACKPSAEAGSVTPQMMADAVHAVLESDRAVYTKQVVNRLQNELGVIRASEHWKQENALPLPAQMFRMGAELATEKQDGLHYALVSLWPINPQNQARTEVEKSGLTFVKEHPDQNYYGNEQLGEDRFFTAVYPDKAIANACVECHNQHRDSPRHDFALGDVMGGVVVRIAERR